MNKNQKKKEPGGEPGCTIVTTDGPPKAWGSKTQRETSEKNKNKISNK